MPQTASPLRWVLNAFRGGRGHPARVSKPPPIDVVLEAVASEFSSDERLARIERRLDALEREREYAPNR